jgi:hypothetical protein
MNDERLGQILRQGDPAKAGDLTPEETRAMRRTVLTAIPDRRRSLFPAFAVAGVAAVAVLIAVVFLKPGPVEAPAPPRVAALPATPRELRPIAPPALPMRQPPLGEAPRPVRHRRHHPATPPALHDTLASLETATLEPVQRQIQFSTPGGTQIIWILTSDKASR